MLALHPDLGVVIGVDTHNDTHTAATGAVLQHLTVPADPAGYRQLIGFGRRHDATLWAIEGTGSFGAGLTTALHACCERVVEVDRPQRPARRGGVKSDDIDAVRAARQALAGVGLSEPRRRGDREAIRVLLTTRGQAVTFRTRAISALHGLVTSAPDGLRERLRTLPLGQLLQTCAGLRDSSVEAWRSPPPCWLCGPPHAGRSPASGRPPSSRSSSTGWSAGSPPSCSASWASARSWPVSSSPPGRITDASVPRLLSPSSAVPRPSKPRRGPSPGTD